MHEFRKLDRTVQVCQFPPFLRVNMTRQEKRWNELRASFVYVRGRKQCKVCHCWIHKVMEDCQPCFCAIPALSKLHKF